MRSFLIYFFFLFSIHGFSQKMNNELLEKILTSNVDSIIGVDGRWQISYKELTMLVITDETNDRMRIVAPIGEIANMTESIFLDCLAANFHTALDIKYAVSNDIMWSVFIHPLSPLSEEEVISAISQVYFGVANFGTTYTSTPLLFGGNNSEQSPDPKLDKG